MSTFLTIATFTGPLEAYIAKGRLESEGITTFIIHKHHIWAEWWLSNALGGIKLQVFQKDGDNAQQIMQSHFDGEYEELLKQNFTDLQSNTCPECKSTNFISSLSQKRLFIEILALGLLATIFPFQRNQHTCQNCSHRWITK